MCVSDDVTNFTVQFEVGLLSLEYAFWLKCMVSG